MYICILFGVVCNKFKEIAVLLICPLVCLTQEKEQLDQLQELQSELTSRTLELESFKGTIDSSEQVILLTLVWDLFIRKYCGRPEGHA